MTERANRIAIDLAASVRLEERREALRLLLALRFGGVDRATDQRISDADSVVLDRWLVAVEHADALRDVFGDE